MENINFSDLGLKLKYDIKSFDFNGKKIEVLQQLPIEDKYDLVMITLQDADDRGIYNPIKLDMHFHLNLVYLYSNLLFTKEEREDEDKLYDILVNSGLMDKIIALIPEEEYNELYNNILETKDIIMQYRNTFGTVIQNLIADLPKQAEVAAKLVEGFDPEKFQGILGMIDALKMQG